MKTKTVYKVVARKGNRLVSPFADTKRDYSIGTVTRPFRGTKLFAFENKTQAKEYANRLRRRDYRVSIYEAEGTGLSDRGMWLSYNIEIKGLTVRDFCAKLKLGECAWSRGSVLCSSIKLIKKV